MISLQAIAARIDQCGEEIDRRNRKLFFLFAQGAVLFTSALLLFTLVLPAYRGLLIPHFSLWIYTGWLYFFARHCVRCQIRQIRRMQYLGISPLLLAAVALGTYLDPTRQALSILLFLCVFPMFIIDRPKRIISFQLIFAGLFVVCSYFAKSYEIFCEDVLYLPIYLAFDLSAVVYSLTEKVESAEMYLMARRESERDGLTDLLNRKSGEIQVKNLLTSQVYGTFAVIDVDDFKSFNDQYGHQVGDDVLRAVSEALREVFGEDNVVCRLGGDEFAVYAVRVNTDEECRQRFGTLMTRLEKAAVAQFEELRIPVSIGCTICRGGEIEFECIYKKSDMALYEAKSAGKGKIVISGT